MTVHLKQDEPDTSNRLDGMKQGVIGQPISRVEGLAKVTGTAPYAAEYPIEGCVEGVRPRLSVLDPAVKLVLRIAVAATVPRGYRGTVGAGVALVEWVQRVP